VSDNRPVSDRFSDFVSQQLSAIHQERSIDWVTQKDEWLSALRVLHSLIESALQQYTESGSISVSYRDVTLNEDYIGEYTAQEMQIRIGRNEIVVKPIGTLMIGSKGCVEVNGPLRRTATFVLDPPSERKNSPNPKDGPYTWKFSQPPSRPGHHVQYLDVVPDVILQALLDVSVKKHQQIPI
jgi:hypothetical protein